MREIAPHRELFPTLTHNHYFNFGGQGPLPKPALEAIMVAYEKLQQEGPFSHRIFDWIERETDRLRQNLAAELGTNVAALTLTENVTAGCNIALWGLDWQAGDRILLTDCEHPGVIAICQEIGRRFGVELDSCPLLETINTGDPIVAIAEHLKPQTRAVVISHVLWNTGQVLPLANIAEVCHQFRRDRPIAVVVDAAQSVGMLPLDLDALGIDFYAFTGHKWLCGPAGVGGLYVRPVAREWLHPTFIGWRGIESAAGQPTGWKLDGRRYEVATSAYPQYAGLAKAIATHRDWSNPRERYEGISRLAAELWQKLSDLPGVTCLQASPPASGLIPFTLDGGKNHRHFARALEERGFLLRTLAHPDCIRACTHYFTTSDEIDALVAAIAIELEQAG